MPLLDSARLILSMILPATPEVKAETFVYSSSDGQALSLDFYPAQLQGLAPLVVVVYGGSWQGGDHGTGDGGPGSGPAVEHDRYGVGGGGVGDPRPQ